MDFDEFDLLFEPVVLQIGIDLLLIAQFLM
jgi:hypothetical protein